MRDKFMFFANFKETADKLPDDLRLKFYDSMTDYVFNGVEPDDNLISALITAIKPSLDKVDERGGAREGAGRPKSNEIKNNQNNSNEIKRNQNNQSFLETETETRNGNKKQETEKYGELGYVRLTAEQYATLKEKYPNLDAAIEVLDTWLGTNGSKHRNKNHYAYFKQNSWVWERVGELRKPVESQQARDSGRIESISEIIERKWKEQGGRPDEQAI